MAESNASKFTNQQGLVIGIDLDGVLYNFSKIVTKAFLEAGIINEQQAVKPHLNWGFYKEAWGMDDRTFWDNFKILVKDGKIYWVGDVHGEPTDALVELATDFGDIYLVTARNIPGCAVEAKAATHYWLQENLGPVPWSGVLVNSDKTCINADIFVDDSVSNLKKLHAAGTLAVCLDRPWNQEWEGDRIWEISQLPDFIRKLKTRSQEGDVLESST